MTKGKNFLAAFSIAALLTVASAGAASPDSEADNQWKPCQSGETSTTFIFQSGGEEKTVKVIKGPDSPSVTFGRHGGDGVTGTALRFTEAADGILTCEQAEVPVGVVLTKDYFREGPKGPDAPVEGEKPPTNDL